MRYPFEDTKTGEPVTLEFPMGEAPGLLDTIEHEGRELVRVSQHVELAFQRSLSDEPGGKMIPPSQPINWPYAKQHDKQGRPVFTSHRECHEAVKRAQADGEYVHAYDSQWGKN